MAEQTYIGVVIDSDPETFVFTTIDLQSGQVIKGMRFATEREIRESFADHPGANVDALIARGRANPIK